MSPVPISLIPDLSSPRSANCFIRIEPWPAGTNTNSPSGLASRARCRNGAKSGLASGTRNCAMTSPPARVNCSMKDFSMSMPGAKSLTSVTTLLMPFFGAHSATPTVSAGATMPERAM